MILEELVAKVSAWGQERKISVNGRPMTQGIKTLEECQVIFDKIAEGDMLVEDLEEVGNFGMDWDYQDDDDWWTMRKGGFDVTYDQALWDTEKDE